MEVSSTHENAHLLTNNLECSQRATRNQLRKISHANMSSYNDAYRQSITKYFQ